MTRTVYSIFYVVFAAMIALAALGLQGCIEESPYYAQHERHEFMSGRHLVCDADGDRCVRCDAEGEDCVPAPGVWHHPYWDPYS